MCWLSKSIIRDIWTSSRFSKIFNYIQNIFTQEFWTWLIKCKPFPSKCLSFVLLLFTVSIFSWRCFIRWLVVIWALKSSLRNAGGDISFKRLYRIVCYGKFSISFAPTCKIMLIRFLWIIEMGLMFYICHYSSCKIAYFNSCLSCFLACLWLCHSWWNIQL